jgi:hypothetical protein
MAATPAAAAPMAARSMNRRREIEGIGWLLS